MLNKEHLLLDRIVITKAQRDYLACLTSNLYMHDYVDCLSIPEFTLVFDNAYIVFKGVALDSPFPYMNVYFPDGRTFNSVPTGSKHQPRNKPFEIVCEITSGKFEKDELEAVKIWAGVFWAVYFGIQFISLHRPEVFTYGEKQVVVPKTIKKNGRYKTVNETKMVKVIHLDPEELSKRHHNITCPSWGVAGHYRHYKDGKVVFIKSYRKGKKRDDPEVYHPKEYQADYPNDKQTEVTDE